jgi:hypothetical protein
MANRYVCRYCREHFEYTISLGGYDKSKYCSYDCSSADKERRAERESDRERYSENWHPSGGSSNQGGGTPIGGFTGLVGIVGAIAGGRWTFVSMSANSTSILHDFPIIIIVTFFATMFSFMITAVIAGILLNNR